MPARNHSSLPIWIAGLAILGAAGLAAAFERPRRAKAETQDRPFGELREDDEPQALQHARARERGRGRHATSPLDIPWRGWKDIGFRTYHQIGADRLLAVAAGVVFFGLLAIFPAITALVSSYGLFADAVTITGHLAFIAALMPAGTFEIVQEQITRLVSKGSGDLGLRFAFGLALAIWSANAGMKAMIDALNVVYGEEEKRSFVKLNLISLALTLGALGVVLAAIGTVVVFPLVLSWIGLGSATQSAIAVLRWPAMLVVLLLALAVLYRVGPSRRAPRWQWLSVGALAAALLWILGSSLFSLYLSNFANYDATYGSLGAVIGLMMWLWLSSIAVLLGAELNSEIEHQTARDSTVGRAKPLGARGATMADTIGEAQS
jgi:membrane protein